MLIRVKKKNVKKWQKQDPFLAKDAFKTTKRFDGHHIYSLIHIK